MAGRYPESELSLRLPIDAAAAASLSAPLSFLTRNFDAGRPLPDLERERRMGAGRNYQAGAEQSGGKDFSSHQADILSRLNRRVSPEYNMVSSGAVIHLARRNRVARVAAMTTGGEIETAGRGMLYTDRSLCTKLSQPLWTTAG